MPRLGWKAVKDGPGQNQGWGFSPAPTAARDTTFGLCNATSSLMVSARTTPARQTRLILISVPQPATECMPQPPGRPSMAAMRGESRMPTVINPPGSDRPACGSSGSSGGYPSSEASISTTMSDEELLNFYGKQLADSGWTMSSPQPVSRTWIRTDSSGTRRVLAIDITPVPGSATCRLLDMQMKFRYR
jgi:hypothetical protein